MEVLNKPKKGDSCVFKSTTTREMLNKLFIVGPKWQQISGIKDESKNIVPPIAKYNPNYKTVEGRIKGSVKLMKPVTINKVLEKK